MLLGQFIIQLNPDGAEILSVQEYRRKATFNKVVFYAIDLSFTALIRLSIT